MYCTNCGQKLDEHVKFCPNCGQPVPSQEATASDPETKKTSEDAATTSQAPAAEVQETAEDAAAHAAAASPHAESDKTTTPSLHAESDQTTTPPPVDHEPSMSGIPAEPDGNGTIRTVGVVLLVLSILFALPQAFNTLGSFFGIFGNLFRFSLHGIMDQTYSLLNFILNALKLAGFLFIGGGAFLIWKKWQDSDAEPLFVTVLAGGVLIVVEALLRGIIMAVFHRYYELSSRSASIGFAVVAIALLAVLISQKQLHPLAGLKGNFAEGLRRDLDRVVSIAQTSHTKGQTANAGARKAGASSAAASEANGDFNQYYQATTQGGQDRYTGPLKTDRSLALYILLGLLTCGIYQLYVLYTIMRDVNVACEGDGKHTPGLLEFIVFGILTCGIYDLYWFYCIGNRLAASAPRYGLTFQENGTSLLLWMLIGSLLCFIGSYVGIYFLIRNTNAICEAYNQQR